ncbi:hypothetical protein ACFE04_001614 [Oxalis oulophora]
MGDTEEAATIIPKQLLSINHQMDHHHIPQLSPSNQMRARHFSGFTMNNFGTNNDITSKRVGIPPSHPNQIPPISPYSQIPVSTRPVVQQMASQKFNPGPAHSRSLSQPSTFFDSLPPLSPSPYRDSLPAANSDAMSIDVTMDDRDNSAHCVLPPSPFSRGNCSGLPPRKAHKRSNSDIPFGFNMVMQSSPPLIPLKGFGGQDSLGMAKQPAQLVKRESTWDKTGDNNKVAEGMGERKSEGEVVDDLLSAYMNLDNIDGLNSSQTDDKNGNNENREDLDSRASGTKNGGESSDNEAESSVNESGGSVSEKREGVKRNAEGNIASTSRHYRSVSMDSFMGKLNFGDESPKLPPSPGPRPGQLSPTNSFDGNSAFSLEFGNGEFSGAELKKIMANEKLAEIALSDPKRAKRILANRQSAARSKERKMRYISELEHKVQTLQIEATTLSAQLTLLQRDSVGLTNQNNELKFRLQSMEQQAQLRDALNDALTTEVRRLKIATQELNGDSDPSKFHHQMFQMQIQESSQLNANQQQQQQNGCAAAKPETNQ